MAVSLGEPVEVLSKRAETSRVYALPDGQWLGVLETAPSSVHVSGDGSHPEDWAELDTTLAVAGDGKVRPAVYSNDLWLSPGGTGPLLHSGIYGSDASVTLPWEGSLPVPVLDGSRATYGEILPGVDLVVDVAPLGFEQYFVVKSAAALAALDSMHLDMAVEGASVQASADGGFSLVDAAGETVGQAPTARAWDAAEDVKHAHPVLQPWTAEPSLSPGIVVSLPLLPQSYSDAIEKATRGLEAPNDHAFGMTVHDLDHRSRIALDVDDAWLRSSDRTFPIIVDPSTTLGSSSWYDMYIR